MAERREGSSFFARQEKNRRAVEVVLRRIETERGGCERHYQKGGKTAATAVSFSVVVFFECH